MRSRRSADNIRRGVLWSVLPALFGFTAFAQNVPPRPIQTPTKPGAELGVEVQAGHRVDTRQGLETAYGRRTRILRSSDCLITEEEFTHTAESADAARTRLADSFAHFIAFTPRPDRPTLLLIERETIFKQSLEAADSPVPDLQMFALRGNSAFTAFAYTSLNGKLVIGKRGDNETATNETATSVKPTSKRAVLADAVVKNGGYIALYGEGRGPFALFALRSEINTGGNGQSLSLHLTLHDATLTLGCHLPLQYLPADTRFQQTLLLVRAPSGNNPTANNLSGHDENNQSDVFAQIQRQLGLDGDPPAYKASVETGAITSTRCGLAMAATEGAIVVNLSQTALPCALPVRVSGLHDNWTVVCADLPLNSKAVPLAPGTLPHPLCAVCEGTAYTALDLNAQARRLFLGHPAICDHADISLRVTAWNPTGLAVELHNPSAQSVRVHVRIHPRLGFGRQALQIPARASVTTRLLWQ